MYAFYYLYQAEKYDSWNTWINAILINNNKKTGSVKFDFTNKY